MNKVSIAWTETMHWALLRSYVTHYRNRELKAWKVVSVNRDSFGYVGNKKTVSFYLDGSKKSFKSEAALLKHINQLNHE